MPTVYNLFALDFEICATILKLCKSYMLSHVHVNVKFWQDILRWWLRSHMLSYVNVNVKFWTRYHEVVVEPCREKHVLAWLQLACFIMHCSNSPYFFFFSCRLLVPSLELSISVLLYLLIDCVLLSTLCLIFLITVILSQL